MSVVEIFVWCLGDIFHVSWRYLVGALEIFCRCPEDISWVSLMDVLEIFDGCSGDI